MIPTVNNRGLKMGCGASSPATPAKSGSKKADRAGETTAAAASSVGVTTTPKVGDKEHYDDGNQPARRSSQIADEIEHAFDGLAHTSSVVFGEPGGQDGKGGVVQYDISRTGSWAAFKKAWSTVKCETLLSPSSLGPNNISVPQRVRKKSMFTRAPSTLSEHDSFSSDHRHESLNANSMVLPPERSSKDALSKLTKSNLLGSTSFGSSYLAEEVGSNGVFYCVKEIRTTFPPLLVSTPRFMGGDQPLEQGPKGGPAMAKTVDRKLSTTSVLSCTGDTIPIDPRVPMTLTMLQKLGHKNLQNILHVDYSDPEVITVVSDFYINCSLEDESGKMNDVHTREVLQDVLKALRYVHSHSIWHGHLKLSNIFKRDAGGFTVGDFGLAQLYHQFAPEVLYSGGFTDPALFPPEFVLSSREQHQHHGDTDEETCRPHVDSLPSDLWSLGVVAYSLRSKRPPFAAATADSLFESILHDTPSPIEHCDPMLMSLIMKMLSKEPADRGTAASLLRDPVFRQFDATSAAALGPAAKNVHHVNELYLFAPAAPQRSSIARSSSNDADSPISIPASFITIYNDAILCSNCEIVITQLMFQCNSCTDYHVCRMCYYQNSFTHDTKHTLSCNVVDSIPETTSSSPTARRGAVAIPAANLSSREATIFAMSGMLPPCLDIERRSHHSVSAREMGRFDAEADLSASKPASHQSEGGSGLKALMRESEAQEEETAERLIEDCIASQSTDLLLSNFGLTVLPTDVIDPPLAHITVLDLANNCLTELPDDIEYLINIRRLLVGNNKLRTLPETLGNLTDLQYLDANHNFLTSLPQSIMFCDELETLALDYNEFEEIPSVLFDVAVRTVYLAANSRIQKWPDRENLKQLAAGLTIGVDNEPDLFQSYRAAFEGITHVSVVWNKIYPDKILPNLYCGSLRAAQSEAVYSHLNITHLLTVGRGLEPQPPEHGKHKVVIVDDIEGATIDFAFEDAIAFIDEAIQANSGCLVHCFAGMSRSATTVIAYLMMRKGMRLDEAYCTTKRGRPAIYPNAGFFKQLLALDAKLYPGQRPLDMDSMERDKVPL